MELSDYRQQIDGIDSQLLALFYQRMEVAAQIAGYKLSLIHISEPTRPY